MPGTICVTTLKQTAVDTVYQIKITLKDSEPPIWRRIQVSGDINLSRLHRVIQYVMGWENDHLHQFIINDKEYSSHAYGPRDFMDETLDADKFQLSQLIVSEGAKFLYQYDFGDDWEHVLVVEKILADQKINHPICLAGARACPPEDCGGIGGYENLLQVVRDPKHKEHKGYLDWLGSRFDPEALELDAINKKLKKFK